MFGCDSFTPTPMGRGGMVFARKAWPNNYFLSPYIEKSGILGSGVYQALYVKIT